MKEYEISYIVRSERGNETLQKLFARHNGEISHTEDLRKIPLAYPIKKETSGYFGFVRISLEPSEIAEFEKEAKLEEEVLRILIISEPITAVRKEMHIPSAGRQAEEAPSRPKEEKEVTNEELEKKLEEILG